MPGHWSKASAAYTSLDLWQVPLFFQASASPNKQVSPIEKYSQVRHMLSPKSETAYLVLCFCVHGRNCKNLFYTLEGMLWKSSKHPVSKIFTEATAPQVFVIWFPSSGVYVSGIQSTCHFVLVWSNQPDATNVGDQMIFCRTSSQDSCRPH